MIVRFEEVCKASARAQHGSLLRDFRTKILSSRFQAGSLHGLKPASGNSESTGNIRNQ